MWLVAVGLSRLRSGELDQEDGGRAPTDDGPSWDGHSVKSTARDAFARASDENGEHPEMRTLVEAIEEKRVETVHRMLETTPELANGFYGSDKRSPLFSASLHGCDECVDALLAAGADLRYEMAVVGWTALIGAVVYGELRVVEKLLAAGANPLRTIRGGDAHSHGKHAIDIAEEFGKTEMKDLLVKWKLKRREEKAASEAQKAAYAERVRRKREEHDLAQAKATGRRRAPEPPRSEDESLDGIASRADSSVKGEL